MPNTLELAIFIKLRFLAGTGCASVICCATPFEQHAHAQRNDKRLCLLLHNRRDPFTTPTAAPHRIATIIAHQIGMKSISLIVIIPARLIVAPIEKSQPPQIMTSVTPNAIISRVAAELNISSRLYVV